MFFIVSKVLSFIIHPLIWVVILLLLSLFSKRDKTKKRLLYASIIVLFIFSNTFLFNVVSHQWETDITDPTKINESYDLAVVLGGMISYNEEKSLTQFASNSDRILNILPLYFDGRVKKILIAGGSGHLSQDEVEANVLANYLIQIGVKADDLLLETRSRNTYENALHSAEIIKHKFQDKKVLLSTSSTHMRRALACFDKQQINCIPFSVDKVNSYSDFEITDLVLPKPSILDKWYWLLHEFIGFASYKFKGYC